MADYNIYLHLDDKGNVQSRTKPFSKTKNRQTSAKINANFNRVVSTIENPDRIVSSAIGAVKALPYVAAAFATVGLVDKTIQTIESFKTIETGDFRFQTQYNNFKSGLRALTRPVATTINSFRAETIYKVGNERRQLQRELLGDSYINSIGGVGV